MAFLNSARQENSKIVYSCCSNTHLRNAATISFDAHITGNTKYIKLNDWLIIENTTL